MCDLQFQDERSLLIAKGLIRNANITFGDSQRPAWLDVKKTQAELRPSRVTRRLAEELRDIAESRGESREDVSFAHRSRSVSRKGVKLANIGRERVIWSGTAQPWLSDAEVSRLEAICESI